MNAYVELTAQEKEMLFRVSKEAGIELSDSGFSRVSKSAQDYKHKNGNLDNWSYKGQSVGAQFARINRAAADERQAVLRASGVKPRYPTKAEVRQVIQIAHDSCMVDGKSVSASAMLRDAGIPAEIAKKLASRRSMHIAAAWADLEKHPARQAMQEQGVLSKRKQRAATGGSIAGAVAALYSLAEHTKDRQRLGAVESEVAVLKARLATLEKRQDVAEAGEHWHIIALRMRGAGPTAIAKATGQQVNTVKKYLQRQREGTRWGTCTPSGGVNLLA